MKKALKWIIGILIGLAVIAVVLGAVYLVASQFGGINWTRDYRLVQRSGPLQDLPRQGMPGQNMPRQNMPRLFERNEMPMYYYGSWGFRPFGGFALIGRLVGGVFRLAFLGLVIFLAVTLALRQKQIKQPVTTSAPLPSVESTQPAILNCPHCAREIQADWKHCPYCGNSLEPAQPETPAI